MVFRTSLQKGCGISGLIGLYCVTCAVQQDAHICSHPGLVLGTQKTQRNIAGLQDADASILDLGHFGPLWEPRVDMNAYT